MQPAAACGFRLNGRAGGRAAEGDPDRTAIGRYHERDERLNLPPEHVFLAPRSVCDPARSRRDGRIANRPARYGALDRPTVHVC